MVKHFLLSFFAGASKKQARRAMLIGLCAPCDSVPRGAADWFDANRLVRAKKATVSRAFAKRAPFLLLLSGTKEVIQELDATTPHLYYI